MDITPYVDTLRRDLVAAAEAGSDELKQAAERLAYALDPSARLALMEAISHAAAEITAELPEGSVDVRLDRPRARLRRRDRAAAPRCPRRPRRRRPRRRSRRRTATWPGSRSASPRRVKARAEEKAAAAGQSLNTWLVDVVRSATNDHAINVDIDLSSVPFVGYDPFAANRKQGRATAG